MKVRALTVSLCCVLTACSTASLQPAASSSTAPSVSTASSASYPVRYLALWGPAGERLQLTVEVARTEQQLSHGLMGRTSLSENTGMLFWFQGDDVRSFWMKNTLIPLDILFFNAAGNYVSQVQMQPCSQDPCQTYSSGAPAAYAIEVPAGSASRWGVGDGWKLQLE